MKLVSLRVENFRSVEDSETFEVDQVTCLVGKNEAGKTAILEALRKLNPVEGEPADFEEEEFPRRHLVTYRQRKDREPANVLTTVWDLEAADTEDLEAHVGTGVITTTRLTITKGYDNRRRVSPFLNEGKIVTNLLASAKLNAAEASAIGAPTTIAALMAKLGDVSGPTEKHNALREHIDNVFPDWEVPEMARQWAIDRLPRFAYFADYDHLPGRVALQDLKQKEAAQELTKSERIFLALLEMASTGISEIQDIGQLEKLIMELEAVSATLTGEIKKYWSQNRHLTVKFQKHEALPQDPSPFNAGVIFETRIYNTRHEASVNFGQRSHGFIWFFSFLVWFSQVKRTYGDNVFLLLDEPGLPLHGRAQEDLIRYMNERLRPDHQVMYTAHSPFMIDVENIFSVRTVEDVVERDADGDEIIKGTKVGDEILSRDEDTLFPIQGKLGFSVTQTLFVGPYVVVVEGATEKAFMDWFSKRLAAEDRVSLDLRWAICPADGASKVTSFVTLFHGRGLKIAALMDYHDGQKALVTSLEESGLLEDGHLLRTDTYADQDSDIEDVVGREMYCALVNRAMGLSGQHELPASRPASAPPRVVKEVEEHCALLPPGFADFGHYLPPAALLGMEPADVAALPGLKEALDRFEKLFEDLNALIS